MIRCKVPRFDMILKLENDLPRERFKGPRCQHLGCNAKAFIEGYPVGKKKLNFCEKHFIVESERQHNPRQK